MHYFIIVPEMTESYYFQSTFLNVQWIAARGGMRGASFDQDLKSGHPKCAIGPAQMNNL